MGNVLDKAPADYSTSDPTKMQGDAWLQTYKHDPYAHTDRIPWGNKGSHLSIGVKVLQEVPGTDLYVQNAQGKKVFITKNGKQLPNSSELIKQDPNYGLGPLVEILGPPTNPQYYMWSGTEMSEGNSYKPVQINSLYDLQYAITSNTNKQIASPALDHQFSGQFGEASISGPFEKMPRDVWSGVGEENRVIGAVGSQLVIPALADVVANVIPGFGMVTQATGLQQDLTNALTSAVDTYKKSMQYKGTATFNTGMANIITDPRLNNYYAEAHTGYTNLSTKTQNHDPSILRMQNITAEQKLLKARALESSAGGMQANLNATQLESLMTQAKTKYPKLDWSYFDQMKYGLAATSDTEAKINILNHFSDKLVSDIKSYPSSPTQTPSSQPTGAGFGPISYNPLVINGSFHHEPGKVVIHG